MTVISTTTNTIYPLLPTIQRAFPNAESYTIENNIVQANAEGFLVQIINESSQDNSSDNNHSDNKSVELFVKCVEASKYSHKPWADLRRTLLYSRTEARFYSDILPLLKEVDDNWDIAPTCYLAESNLDQLIGEDESAAAKPLNKQQDPKYDIEDTTVLEGKGGNLILASLKEGYYQTSPLTLSQTGQCLKAIAKFHARAFGNKDILEQVSIKLCEYGGSYHLKNRNVKELTNIQKTWDDLVNHIQKAAPKGFFDRDQIRTMGQRIYEIAEHVSEELSPTYDSDYATIVHGDYKAMNVFLPTDETKNKEHPPLLIDFASCGVGVGLSDVAMLITHAVHPSDLVNGGEEKLVMDYISDFQNALPPSSKQGGVVYSQEKALRHYKYATVDYFRFVLGRLWRGATLESFEKKKDSKNAVFVSRNIEAALAFIERAEKYLTEIEEQRKNNQES